MLIAVLFKALHEAMLRAFCREAAWLMQACVNKRKMKCLLTLLECMLYTL